MGRKRTIGCAVLIFVSFLITGCWDRRELQDRNFVLAVAIDRADNSKTVESFVKPHGAKPYQLSLQLLKPAAGSDGKDKSKTYVISNTGDSMFEMVRDMLGQSSKSLWFEHLQVIVISESVLKENGLGEILDFFIRDSEMRSRIKLYITSGKAKEFVEYVPLSKGAGGLHLAEIIRLHTRNIHAAGARTDLGFTTQSLDNNSDIILPRIEIADKVVKVGGAALFNKDIFVGYADEYAIAGRKFVAGTEKSAVVTIPCPDHLDHQVVFELYRHDTTLRPHIEGENLYFTLDINMYGNIGELQGDIERDNTNDSEYIQKLEMAFAEEIKHTVLYGENVFRKQMKVDSINLFGGKVRAYEPDTWARIKDQWHEIYPSTPLIISVNVSIRNTGSHK